LRSKNDKPKSGMEAGFGRGYFGGVKSGNLLGSVTFISGALAAKGTNNSAHRALSRKLAGVRHLFSSTPKKQALII
jgi:hypothetical protein